VQGIAAPQEALQDQVQGPTPLTTGRLPSPQRLVVGFAQDVPAAEPQELDAPALAPQGVVVPPFVPKQVQFQGPAPAVGKTVVAVPGLQRLSVGLAQTVVPFAVPQAPLTGGAGQVIVFGELVN
jgi:hypothetical protein